MKGGITSGVVYPKAVTELARRYRFRLLGENDFGICHLGPSDEGESLTPWLHALIQKAAGRGASDPPLTFGDLWGGDPEVEGHDGAERAIDLQMISTDLSRGRPMRLP